MHFASQLPVALSNLFQGGNNEGLTKSSAFCQDARLKSLELNLNSSLERERCLQVGNREEEQIPLLPKRLSHGFLFDICTQSSVHFRGNKNSTSALRSLQSVRCDNAERWHHGGGSCTKWDERVALCSARMLVSTIEITFMDVWHLPGAFGEPVGRNGL